jgi:hypothetical protein
VCLVLAVARQEVCLVLQAVCLAMQGVPSLVAVVAPTELVRAGLVLAIVLQGVRLVLEVALQGVCMGPQALGKAVRLVLAVLLLGVCLVLAMAVQELASLPH